jgi:hypothetical protein
MRLSIRAFLGSFREKREAETAITPHDHQNRFRVIRQIRGGYPGPAGILSRRRHAALHARRRRQESGHGSFSVERVSQPGNCDRALTPGVRGRGQLLVDLLDRREIFSPNVLSSSAISFFMSPLALPARRSSTSLSSIRGSKPRIRSIALSYSFARAVSVQYSSWNRNNSVLIRSRSAQVRSANSPKRFSPASR